MSGQHRGALAASLIALTLTVTPRTTTSSAPSQPGVAVVELFTSEGCSSCPPADELLGRLAAEAARAGEPVYCLSFHVDYWDHLGWKDRFSSPAWTRRQSDYLRTLGAGQGIYTPQMVVNGTRGFVGSDRATADAVIHIALEGSSTVPVRVSAGARGNEVTAHCAIAGAPNDAVLEVAWVQSSAVSAPNRGENDGRTLHHVNVVRDLRSLAIAGSREATIRLKRPEIADGAVIAWVRRGDGRVIGAAAARVPRS